VPAFVLGGPISVRVGLDQSMVGGADEGGVVDTGWSAECPRHDVVGFAVPRFTVAAGEDAPAVPDGDGLPEVAGEQPGRAADVEDLGVGSEDDGEDVGVTRQPACLGWTDPGVRSHQGRAGDTPDQVVVVDEDNDAWPVTTVLGCVTTS